MTEPKVIEVDVRPKRLASGQFTLYQYTYFDQTVFNKSTGSRVQKGTRIVWPPCKQENGLGMRFGNALKAMKYFFENKGDMEIVKGTMLHKRLVRMKFIEI